MLSILCTLTWKVRVKSTDSGFRKAPSPSPIWRQSDIADRVLTQDLGTQALEPSRVAFRPPPATELLARPGAQDVTSLCPSFLICEMNVRAPKDSVHIEKDSKTLHPQEHSSPLIAVPLHQV